MFCIYPRTNSDSCHLQNKLSGFYNPDEKCLLRGTDWVFKSSSLRFVFKGLSINLHSTGSMHVKYRRSKRREWGSIFFFYHTLNVCHLKTISDRCDVAFTETDGSWRISARTISEFVVSGFNCEVDENSAPLSYYAASSGNILPTFRKDGTDWLSRNVGTKLPLFAA